MKDDNRSNLHYNKCTYTAGTLHHRYYTIYDYMIPAVVCILDSISEFLCTNKYKHGLNVAI